MSRLGCCRVIYICTGKITAKIANIVHHEDLSSHGITKEPKGTIFQDPRLQSYGAWPLGDQSRHHLQHLNVPLFRGGRHFRYLAYLHVVAYPVTRTILAYRVTVDCPSAPLATGTVLSEAVAERLWIFGNSESAGIRQGYTTSHVLRRRSCDLFYACKIGQCRYYSWSGDEVGESSADGTARQVGLPQLELDLYGFCDNVICAPGRSDSTCCTGIGIPRRTALLLEEPRHGYIVPLWHSDSLMDACDQVSSRGHIHFGTRSLAQQSEISELRQQTCQHVTDKDLTEPESTEGGLKIAQEEGPTRVKNPNATQTPSRRNYYPPLRTKVANFRPMIDEGVTAVLAMHCYAPKLANDSNEYLWEQEHGIVAYVTGCSMEETDNIERDISMDCLPNSDMDIMNAKLCVRLHRTAVFMDPLDQRQDQNPLKVVGQFSKDQPTEIRQFFVLASQLRSMRELITTHDLTWAVVFALKDLEALIMYGTKCMVVTDHKEFYSIFFNQMELNTDESCIDVSVAYRKEREPPLRVRALVMTISLDLPKQILNAQTKARKPNNIKSVDGWRSRAEHLRTIGLVVQPEDTSMEVGSISRGILSKDLFVGPSRGVMSTKPLAFRWMDFHFDVKLKFVEEPSDDQIFAVKPVLIAKSIQLVKVASIVFVPFFICDIWGLSVLKCDGAKQRFSAVLIPTVVMHKMNPQLIAAISDKFQTIPLSDI
ncbi:hypothetical protein Tco_0894243 [Tanacetum coccineum]|uniref:Reverse transcriptase RNase H-like domain-containing protein n=1 Tax=Tanacetum coccineum TaxID=301880 RepID=A0ABQ5CB48_9ASTR